MYVKDVDKYEKEYMASGTYENLEDNKKIEMKWRRRYWPCKTED